jgi:tRNA(Ile2) C34 agmatinyltransferase TiaS
MQYPVKAKEYREACVSNDKCPECGGELDTGYECSNCGYDALEERT